MMTDSRRKLNSRTRILRAARAQPGATLREIAVRVGCHPDTVRRHLPKRPTGQVPAPRPGSATHRRSGAAPRRRPVEMRLQAALRRQAAAALAQPGATLQRIAAAAGCDVDTVRRHLTPVQVARVARGGWATRCRSVALLRGQAALRRCEDPFTLARLHAFERATDPLACVLAQLDGLADMLPGWHATDTTSFDDLGIGPGIKKACQGIVMDGCPEDIYDAAKAGLDWALRGGELLPLLGDDPDHCAACRTHHPHSTDEPM